MTVKQVHETFVCMDAVEFDRTIGEKKDVFPARKMRTEVAVEADQESEGSTTKEAETESPQSVAKFGRKRLGRFVHSQVLRVKEEELLLREDVDGEGCLNNKERKKSDSYQEGRVNIIFFARPILPCSPLSGKTATTSLRAASH